MAELFDSGVVKDKVIEALIVLDTETDNELEVKDLAKTIRKILSPLFIDKSFETILQSLLILVAALVMTLDVQVNESGDIDDNYPSS